MINIPYAIYANAEKVNKTIFDMVIEGNNRDFFGTTYTLFLKHNGSKQAEFFFNKYDPDRDEESIRNDYYLSSNIYMKNMMNSSIMIFYNLFDSNIATHGGAIHIDNRFTQNRYKSQEENNHSPRIHIFNNRFTRNMAYFQGNAIYISGAQENP